MAKGEHLRGKKTGGRQKGSLNKITRGFREAQAELQRLFDSALQDEFHEKVFVTQKGVDGRIKRVFTGEMRATGKSNLLAFIEGQVRKAIEGDSVAAAVVMDRWAGKPQQRIKVDDQDDAVMFALGSIAEEALKQQTNGSDGAVN